MLTSSTASRTRITGWIERALPVATLFGLIYGIKQLQELKRQVAALELIMEQHRRAHRRASLRANAKKDSVNTNVASRGSVTSSIPVDESTRGVPSPPAAPNAAVSPASGASSTSPSTVASPATTALAAPAASPLQELLPAGLDISIKEIQSSVLEQIDQLHALRDYESAQNLLSKQGDCSAEILWRRARLSVALAYATKVREGVSKCRHSEAARALLLEGFEYASAALQADESCAACHMWYGSMLEATARFAGTKAEIQAAFQIKDSFERAAELDPTDPWAHFLLGSWHFEVASISWATRKMASAAFATPPTSSFEKAIAEFETAEQINPGFSSRNQLMFGKAYLKLGQRAKAREWLESAVNLTPGRTLNMALESDHEEKAVLEARKLIESAL